MPSAPGTPSSSFSTRTRSFSRGCRARSTSLRPRASRRRVSARVRAARSPAPPRPPARATRRLRPRSRGQARNARSKPEATSQNRAVWGEENYENKTEMTEAPVSANAAAKAQTETKTEAEAPARTRASVTAKATTRAKSKWRARARAKGRVRVRAVANGDGGRLDAPHVAVSLRDGRGSRPLPISQWRLSAMGELVLGCSLRRRRGRPAAATPELLASTKTEEHLSSRVAAGNSESEAKCSSTAAHISALSMLSQTQLSNSTQIASPGASSSTHSSQSLPTVPALPTTSMSASLATPRLFPTPHIRSQETPFIATDSYSRHDDESSTTTAMQDTHNLPSIGSVDELLAASIATQMSTFVNQHHIQQRETVYDQYDEGFLIRSLILHLLENQTCFSISTEDISTQKPVEVTSKISQPSATGTDFGIQDGIVCDQEPSDSDNNQIVNSDVAIKQAEVLSHAFSSQINKPTTNENVLHLIKGTQQHSSGGMNQNITATKQFIQLPSADDLREIPANKIPSVHHEETIATNSYDQYAHLAILDQKKSSHSGQTQSRQTLGLEKECVHQSSDAEIQEIQQPPPTHTLAQLLGPSEVYHIHTTDQQNLICPTGKKVQRVHQSTTDMSHVQKRSVPDKCHRQISSDSVQKPIQNSLSSNAKRDSLSVIVDLKHKKKLQANQTQAFERSPPMSYLDNVQQNSSIDLNERSTDTKYLQLTAASTATDLYTMFISKSSGNMDNTVKSYISDKQNNQEKLIPNELLAPQSPPPIAESVKWAPSPIKLDVHQSAEDSLFVQIHVGDKRADQKLVATSRVHHASIYEIQNNEPPARNCMFPSQQTSEENELMQRSGASTNYSHLPPTNDKEFVHNYLVTHARDQQQSTRVRIQRNHLFLTSRNLQTSLEDDLQQTCDPYKQECPSTLTLDPAPITPPSKQRHLDVTRVQRVVLPETRSVPSDFMHDRSSLESEKQSLRKPSTSSTRLPSFVSILSEPALDSSTFQDIDHLSESWSFQYHSNTEVAKTTDPPCPIMYGDHSTVESPPSAAITASLSSQDDPHQITSEAHLCLVSPQTQTEPLIIESNDGSHREVPDDTENCRTCDNEAETYESQYSLHYLFMCAAEAASSTCTEGSLKLNELTTNKVNKNDNEEMNKSISVTAPMEAHQPASGSSGGGGRRRDTQGPSKSVGAAPAATAASHPRAKRHPLLRKMRDALRVRLAPRLTSPPCQYLLRPSHTHCPAASGSVVNAQRHSEPDRVGRPSDATAG